ncbi:MAG: arginine--tRNA ligase [Candidatus Colwellbacteria bacterium]|nr:arginine--tRNA ligase [Candidatus Colwellbacteria bacterium]
MLAFIRELIASEVGSLDVKVTVPEFSNQGHFSTNVAFLLAEKNKTSPIGAAEGLRQKLLKNPKAKVFSKIEVANPGYLNFWFTPEYIQSEFLKIAKAKDTYGKSNLGSGKKAIVEYSSPNIAKAMHVGHLRSTVIGDAVANIHEFLGYKVIRWNYIGDWGTQFGKLIAAYKLWGSKSAVEKEPIEALTSLYVRFHDELKRKPGLEKRGQEEFQKLEEGDKENRTIWEWFRKESLEDFERIYKVLGVKFDTSIGESFYEKDLKNLTANLLKSGVAKKSEGAVIVPLQKFNLPPGLIQKSDGASLYLTRDIVNIKYRVSKYKPEKILYVVGNEQALHFEQVFAVAKTLKLGGEFSHIKFGTVLGEDGKKLASREGKTPPLGELIEKSVRLAREVVDKKNPKLTKKEKDEIAEAVGIGAFKYNDLSQNRLSDISFNWNKMLNLEGNSAPYLQYTYARLRSILRKAGRSGKFSVKRLTSEADLNLILKLSGFPDVLAETSRTYFPHYLTDYLYDLARATNLFYETEPVLKSEPGLKSARLALIAALTETLKTGLNLLGIKTPEKL